MFSTWGNMKIIDSIMGPFFYNGVLDMKNMLDYILLTLSVVGVIIAIVFFRKARNNHNYKHEISLFIKTTILLLGLSVVVNGFLKANSLFVDLNIYMTCIVVSVYIIAVAIFLLDKFLFYKKSTNNAIDKKYINNQLIITYVFIVLTSFNNVTLKVFLVVLALDLVFFKCTIKEASYNGEDNKGSVESSDNNTVKLYETRQYQLDIIKSVVNSISDENYSIALNGQWGSGKSVIIDSLINDLKQHEYTIHIKPMISDTKEILVKEFKKELGKIMKSQGVYTGSSGSVEKYYKEVLNLIQINAKVTISNFIDMYNDDTTFKEAKEDLQKDIDKLLINEETKRYEKKIIIVIDDFDRVPEENQKEIISFINEVVDFKGCITLVALDYEIIKQNTTVKPTYLEKFINTTIDIIDVEFEEIASFHRGSITSSNQKELGNIAEKLQDNIVPYMAEINSRIEYYIENLSTANKNKDIKNLKNVISEDINKAKAGNDDEVNDDRILCEKIRVVHSNSKIQINNSRRVIQFIKEINNSLVLVEDLYCKKSNEASVYLTEDHVDAHKVIFILNYIKVFFKEDYYLLVKAKSIEKWLYGLEEAKRKYFELILNDILEFIDKPSLSKNIEVDKKKKHNNYRLINNIFINYKFAERELELYTESDKIIRSIKEDNINIIENHVDTIGVYRDVVERKIEDYQEAKNMHKKIADYICQIYNSRIINSTDLINIIFYQNNSVMTKHFSIYMDEVLIKVDKVRLNEFLKNKGLAMCMQTLGDHNIATYAYEINMLISIRHLQVNGVLIRDGFIKESESRTLEYIKKFCKENQLIGAGIINSNNLGLDKIVRRLRNLVKKEKSEIINIERLEPRLDEFLSNYISIRNLTKKRQEQLDYENNNLYITDYNEAIKVIKELRDADMNIKANLRDFNNALERIIHEKNLPHDDLVDIIRDVYNNIDKNNQNARELILSIMVYVEYLLVQRDKVLKGVTG